MGTGIGSSQTGIGDLTFSVNMDQVFFTRDRDQIPSYSSYMGEMKYYGNK